MLYFRPARGLSLIPHFSEVWAALCWLGNRFNGFLGVRAATFSRVVLGLLLLASGLPSQAETPVADCDEDSLRDAISTAANDDGVVVFTEDCTITLTAPLVINTNLLDTNITTQLPDIIIDSQGHAVVIQGDVGVRVFEIFNDANVTLLGITIANGQTNFGGGLYIADQATVTLTNCVLAGNVASGTNGVNGADGANSSTGSGGNGRNGTAGEAVAGGAIYNLGMQLTLLNCFFETNSATGSSGGNGGNGGSGVSNAGSGGNGGLGAGALGGAVYSVSDVVVSNCTFSGNTVSGGDGGTGGAAGASGLNGLAGNGAAGGAASGAGIYCLGAATVVGSTFSDNSAQSGNSAAGGTQVNGNGTAGPNGPASFGGGVYAVGGTLINNTFYNDNVAGGAGGNGGPGTHNAGNGGNGGNATGGGLYSTADIEVISCTFSNCNATGGTNGVRGSSGIAGSNGSPGASRGGDIAHGSGVFALRFTILATNSSGGANYGTITDGGYNIGFGNTITFTNATSFKTNNVKLGALADNGGPTKTMKPAADSPALDQIPPDADFPDTDQRGIPRPININADIGAVELEQDKGPPVITMDPTNAPAFLGSNATFFATAHGSPTLKYIWRLNGTAIPGVTRSSFIVTNAAPSNAGPYTVAAMNTIGTSTNSPPAFVRFAPSITNQPDDQPVNPGDTAFFEVGVLADTNQLTFQWKLNGSDIPNATSSTLTINNAQTADTGNYTVAITNAYGGTISAPAALNMFPGIITPPASQTVRGGTNVVFTVNAAGSLPLAYQWRFNGNNLVGNTGPSLTKANVQPSDAGGYDVVVTNRFGSVTSVVATLTVTSASSPVVTQPHISSNNFTFAVSSQTGFTYVVDYKTNPLSGNWTPLSTNIGTSTNFIFSTPATNPMRFFRVRVQ